MRIVAALSIVLGGAVAAAAPVAHWDAGPGGFIDDGYALRSDGKAAAFITTDGATKATLHLAEVGGADMTVEGAPIDASAIYWLGAARGLIVRGPEGVGTGE